VPDDELDPLFARPSRRPEEAVFNALWAAPDVGGRKRRVAPGLPHPEVLERLRRHGRIMG